jgi:hypothetical protein
MVLAFLAPVLAGAQGLQVSIPVPVHAIAHPVQAYRSVRADKRLLAIADTLLEEANTVDYVTTRRGAFPGTGGCELNPLLTTAPCQIDVPRFTGIKLVAGAFGVVQWLPVWRGWGGERYIRAVTVLDVAIAIPLAIADVNNVIQLTK